MVAADASCSYLPHEEQLLQKLLFFASLLPSYTIVRRYASSEKRKIRPFGAFFDGRLSSYQGGGVKNGAEGRLRGAE